MELGKVPPHDTEAEQAVIGSMLTDKDAIISAIEVLKEDDFYREDNRLIYGAILSLYSRNEPIDIITVKAELDFATNKASLYLNDTLVKADTSTDKITVSDLKKFAYNTIGKSSDMWSMWGFMTVESFKVSYAKTVEITE